MAMRLTREIDVNDDTLAYETVAQVGPGGSYLAADHTLRWLRSGEHYYGGSFNRLAAPGEENSMLARAHRRVVDILAQPLRYQAPADALKRIRAFVGDHARQAKVPVPEWTAE